MEEKVFISHLVEYQQQCQTYLAQLESFFDLSVEFLSDPDNVQALRELYEQKLQQYYREVERYREKTNEDETRTRMVLKKDTRNRTPEENLFAATVERYQFWRSRVEKEEPKVIRRITSMPSRQLSTHERAYLKEQREYEWQSALFQERKNADRRLLDVVFGTKSSRELKGGKESVKEEVAQGKKLLQLLGDFQQREKKEYEVRKEDVTSTPERRPVNVRHAGQRNVSNVAARRGVGEGLSLFPSQKYSPVRSPPSAFKTPISPSLPQRQTQDRYFSPFSFSSPSSSPYQRTHEPRNLFPRGLQLEDVEGGQVDKKPREWNEERNGLVSSALQSIRHVVSDQDMDSLRILQEKGVLEEFLRYLK